MIGNPVIQVTSSVTGVMLTNCRLLALMMVLILVFRPRGLMGTRDT
jgi:ABC-type branched-subunit amino acid transport system permease subunit